MRNLLIASAVFSTTFGTISEAGEFGNVFGNEALAASSRAASAQALLAIEELIRGIRIRELQEGSGIEELASAISNLREATDAMRSLLEQDFPKIELNEEQRAFIASQVAGRIFGEELSASTTLDELFEAFITIGEILASRLTELVDGGDSADLIFPEISPLLQAFLMAGEIVSEVASG